MRKIAYQASILPVPGVYILSLRIDRNTSIHFIVQENKKTGSEIDRKIVGIPVNDFHVFTTNALTASQSCRFAGLDK